MNTISHIKLELDKERIERKQIRLNRKLIIHRDDFRDV